MIHNNLKILAVIPARGGSKQIPRKNLVDLCGKPLIAHTIDLARKAKKLIYRTVVSTDDNEIARISKKYGADVPFIRPKELATDNASMIPVLKHAVSFVERQDKIKIDIILLLQPTDPLRQLNDISKSIEIAKNNKCDSVISVERVYSHHPILMKKIVKGKLEPFILNEIEGTPRQKYKPPAYMRNGCIYLIKRNILMKDNSIRGEISIPMIMEEGSRISIDNINDLRLVEMMMKIKN